MKRGLGPERSLKTEFYFRALQTAASDILHHHITRCRLKTLNAKTTFHCLASFSGPRSIIRKTFGIKILPTRPVIRKTVFPLLELRFYHQIFFQVVLGSVTIARSKVDIKEGIKAVVVVVIAAVLLLLLLIMLLFLLVVLFCCLRRRSRSQGGHQRGDQGCGCCCC